MWSPTVKESPIIKNPSSSTLTLVDTGVSSDSLDLTSVFVVVCSLVSSLLFSSWVVSSTSDVSLAAPVLPNNVVPYCFTISEPPSIEVLLLMKIPTSSVNISVELAFLIQRSRKAVDWCLIVGFLHQKLAL